MTRSDNKHRLAALAVCGVAAIVTPVPVAGQSRDGAASESPEARSATPATQPSVLAATDMAIVADQRRLVHVFDFNERPLGNFESLPMRWTRHRDWGFPHYLPAGFDGTLGHDAPPSFRLGLNGGSIAFQYRERTIEVLPNSDYVIFAWMRTEGLQRARATIGAALMDRAGEEIPGTERLSRSIGGPQENGRWHQLTIHIPGGVHNARFISLSVWLIQPGAMSGQRCRTPASADDIEDMRGDAWLDDIRVYRLPRAQMDTGIPGNIFGPDRAPALRVLVSDPDGVGLTARLVVRDADGVPRVERVIPIKPVGRIEPDTIELTTLEPGLYQAELSVSTPTGVLASRTERFARLGPRFHSAESLKRPGRGFGVTVTRLADGQLADQLALIRQLGPEWVKMPVWLLASADSPAAPAVSNAIETHLTELAGGGHEVIGWIGPDHRPPGHGRETDSLLDLLSADPATWRPKLAHVWSRYAGLIRWWQIGDEQDSGLVWDPRLSAVAAVVQREMSDVVSNPTLVIPGNILKTPPGEETIGNATAMYVPAVIPPRRIPEHWPSAEAKGSGNLWVTVETLPLQRYPRVARATDLVKRLVLAKANDPAAIFVPQPWTLTESGRAWPTEDYLIFHTIADILGGSRPAGKLTIDGQVECYVFDRGGSAVLAAWDDYATPAGRDHWMPLQPGARQIDPWGRLTELNAAGTEYRVRIGPTPTFLEPLPTWLVKLRQSFAIAPPHVEASLIEHEASLRFANPFAEPISGEVRLVMPPGWETRPSHFRFALPPRQVHEERIALRFPLNESSGTKVLLSEFVIEADRNYHLRIPAWFELGLEGIEVETFTQRAGDDLVIRQLVTNHTGQPVSFYSYLATADRERLNRIIANLQPGQTATKEYVLNQAAQLTGHRLRLGLQEVGGSRVWNRLFVAP